MYQVVFITTKYFIYSALVQRCSIDQCTIQVYYIPRFRTLRSLLLCSITKHFNFPYQPCFPFQDSEKYFVVLHYHPSILIFPNRLHLSFFSCSSININHISCFRAPRILLWCCTITRAPWLVIYIPYFSIRFLFQDTEKSFVVLHYHPSTLTVRFSLIPILFPLCPEPLVDGRQVKVKIMTATTMKTTTIWKLG